MMIWYDSGEKRRTIRVWSFRIEGVALWWKKDLQVLLLSFSPNHTDISVLVSGGSQALQMTGIYGFSSIEQRAKTWDLIRLLPGQHQMLWFIGGDFNEVMNSREKEGGRDRSQSQMDAFRGTLGLFAY